MQQKRNRFLLAFCLVVMMSLFIETVRSSSSGVVLELTSQNFASTVEAPSNHHRVYFVKFFAPWCGHCKRLAPVWSELAKELEDSSIPHYNNVQLAKINCDEHSDVCRKFSIRGYPTLKLFANGKPVTEYYGQRSIPKIKGFLDDVFSKSKSTGKVEDIIEVDLEAKIKNDHRNWVVMFYNPDSSSFNSYNEKFTELATQNKDTFNFFARVNCNQEIELCTKRFGLDTKTKPVVLYFTGKDRSMSVFTQDISNLQQFIESDHTKQKVPVPGPVDNTPTIIHFLTDHPYISIGIVTLFCVAILGIFLAVVCMSDDTPERRRSTSDATSTTTPSERTTSEESNKDEPESPPSTTNETTSNTGSLKERKPRSSDHY
ncbi:hypothetical protein FDP41_009077 [Naegleria fowleri]|uniref:Thioredoxin domain-containing protein n=1 Tax=Naegleria fowleri TaxID=5763 RepID=A0A6A5BFS7_NAEFO|nr:uncharacterized protein FDP41_009077 [Naegleria fowleri]KAF0972828.1 hypothetical protein FDP41_009077 [Naegleria fowleri]